MAKSERSRSIPLTEKIPLYFIIIGLLSILVVGLFAFYSAKDAMINRTFDQLTSVRIEKQKRIEKLFEDAQIGLKILSSDDLSYFESKSVILESDSLNSKLYPPFLKYRNSGKIYNRIYIIINKNVFEIGSESEVIKNYQIEENLSLQSTLNSFTDISKNNLNQYSFYESNTCVFVGATNLKRNNSQYNIVAEINQEAIDNIMLENNPHNGLGKSGEAYLVGEDKLLRSRSRFIDPSVRIIAANTQSVIDAFNNNEGFHIIEDYRGIEVLSSFSQIKAGGISWAILAEIDKKEAIVPISQLRIKIMASSVVISLILLLISFATSRQLIKPLKDLSKRAIEVGKGNYVEVTIPSRNDEIGDLTDSFNHMVSELKSKDEALKIEKIKQLRSMIDGQELERQRLSRELHDGLGQSLFGIKMKLENLFAEASEEEINKKSEIMTTFDSTIEEVRRMSNNLKPAVLEDFGIANALKNLCKQYENLNFSIISSIEDKDVKLAKRAQTYIFRIAQEALNNVVKHANPENVSLNFYSENKSIILSIEDDGTGFDVERAILNKGNGLNNMTERVNLLRGELNINSIIDRGTIVTITIPHNCMV